MRLEKIKSYAKINFSLNVLSKNKFKLHSLETLVGFIDLYDEIFIKQINSKNHQVRFSGRFSNKINKNNTISLLLNILDKSNKLKNKKFYIHIKKNIPQMSGLGGGSMNAASLIKYLVNKNKIKLTKKETISLSSKIGSDVILGMSQKNMIIGSKRKIKIINKNINLFTLLIKPNFGCSTKVIFKEVKKFSKPDLSKIKKNNINYDLLFKLKNDLEIPAFKKYPKLKKIKFFFQNIDQSSLVRMSGSGSTIVGYFRSKKAALYVKKLLKKNYKNYWCNLSKTI